MFRYGLSIFVFFVLLGFSQGKSFANVDLKGRFRGYLLPDKLHLKIPLQLDFFRVGPQTYSAVLRLNLGHFNSHEYVSQYYEEVVYSADGNEIVLDSDDWDLSLFELELIDKSLKGKFRSHSGYAKGKVLLRKLPPEPELAERVLLEQVNHAELHDRPTFPLLSGQYEGVCDEVHKYLQVEASKWFSIFEPVQTPFYGYKFTGRLGVSDGSCGGSDSICIQNNFEEGTFNPYSGFIKMTGQPQNIRLSLDYPFLNLNGCKLKKTKELDLAYQPKDEPLSTILENIEAWRRSDNKTEELTSNKLDGYYKGFLYHTQLNRYQVMDVSVESIRQARGRSHIHFFPSAWLHFEHPNEDGDFKISFPFKKVIFNPRHPYMVWDSGLDALAKIDCWQKDLIMGQWISRTFGVVGPFVLARHGTQIPFVVNGIKLKSGLGMYEGKNWLLELFALEDRNPIDLASFFPIQIYGGAHIPGVTEMKTVDAGVYDFYSGSIAFRLSDTRVVTGRIHGDDLRLFWPSYPRWGVKMLPMDLQLFKHVGDAGR
ncbi:MAG: hypothetical protein HRU09_11795 [Oligoflexales bacterium]|nr:hypothetical protein [Oligoflexales bacterium]